MRRAARQALHREEVLELVQRERVQQRDGCSKNAGEVAATALR